MKIAKWMVVVFAVGLPAAASARTFSVECVDNYAACGGGSLSDANDECDDIQDIMTDAGHTEKWNFRDGDVWGNDFRDKSPTEEFSDEAEVFFYAGHGTCVGGQGKTCDRPFTCANTPKGGNNTVVVASQSRWGSLSPNKGKARWMVHDSSCSMEVVPGGTNAATVSRLATGWLPAFDGMHLAVGGHCSPTADMQDSEDRGEDFVEDLTDGDGFTNAWMDDGLIDVDDGACAVTMAGGSSSFIALTRMLFEGLSFSFNDTGGKATFLAYSYVCE
jgi:hypothetical protein